MRKMRILMHTVRRKKIIWSFIIAIVILVYVISRTPSESESIQDASEYLPNNNTLYLKSIKFPIKSLLLSFPNIPSSVSLITLVLCHPSQIHLRNQIRDTWANQKYSESLRDNSTVVLFLMGTSENDLELKSEMDLYNDILQVDVQETYKNLLYKLIIAYRWIESLKRHIYILKVDSDVVVKLDEIKSIMTIEDDIIQCSVWKNVIPKRDPQNPWFIPKSSWSEEYLPTYCNGPIYLIGPKANSKLLETLNSKSFQIFEVEDAFLTGVIAYAAGIVRKDENRIWKKPHSYQECINDSPTVIGYPVHHDPSIPPFNATKEYQNLLSIPCGRFWSYLFSFFSF